MPAFLSGAAQWVFNLIINNGDKFVKIAFVASLLSAFLLMYRLIGGFLDVGYNKVTDAISGFASQSIPEGMQCVLHNLGIDAFLTSALAIFVSSSVFWGSSVLLIFMYRGALKVLKIKSLRS